MVTSNPEGYLGCILDSRGASVGTCFQVDKGILVTAYHVLRQALDSPELDLSEGQMFWYRALEGDDDPFSATVLSLSKENDLAVLKGPVPLAASISHLMESHIPNPGDKFHMTGFGTLPEEYFVAEYRRISATGRWTGVDRRSNNVLVGAGHAPDAARGMSGCPVIRSDDKAVIGVLSGRYNSEDGWSQGRVWISRVEDLLALLPSGTEVAVQHAAPTEGQRVSALSVTQLDKRAILDNPYYFAPPGWEAAQGSAKSALEDGKIVIVVAASGIGSTTFANRLIAEISSDRANLLQLDPGDWDTPLAAAIQPKPWSSYVLDLRDPQHDRPSGTFLDDLQSLSVILKGYRSHLVITIREELWRGAAAKSYPDLSVVRLLTPPDPQELVRRYVGRRYPELVQVVEVDQVRQHLDGLNAVQAVAIAAEVCEVLQESAEEGRSDQAEIVAQTLDDHARVLDVLYADPDSASLPLENRPELPSGYRAEPLPIEDRCLLFALAVRGSLRASQLESEADRLMSVLRPSKQNDPAKKRLDQVFARPGLRGRLRSIGASLSNGELATLGRSSFGTAVVRYVWDNYRPLREALTEWLLRSDSGDRDEAKRQAEWISDLVRRNQDIDFVRNELRRLVRRLGKEKDHVLVDVLCEAVLDLHLQRRCERLLYDWAEQIDMQKTVVEVSRRSYADTRRPIFVRRLLKVADAPRVNPEAVDDVRRSFTQFVANPKVRPEFMKLVESWVRNGESATPSVRHAFSAAIATEGGSKWFLQLEDEGADMRRMLSHLISDPAAHSAIAYFVHDSSDSIEDYERVLDAVADAAIAHGALLMAFSLSDALAAANSRKSFASDLQERLRLARVE